MSVTWTLTRDRIADKALEKCNVLGVGKLVSPEDRELAVEALDGILKSLPIYGYVWPKVNDSQTDISLLANTSPTSLPSDYYGELLVNIVDADGNETPLPLVTLAEWSLIEDKDFSANYPEKAYIDNSNQLLTWPVQDQAVTLKAYYQKVIDDTVDSTPPDIGVPFIMGLVYGVAAEIGDEFYVDENKLKRFETKWAIARSRGLMTMNKSVMTLEVDD